MSSYVAKRNKLILESTVEALIEWIAGQDFDAGVIMKVF